MTDRLDSVTAGALRAKRLQAAMRRAKADPPVDPDGEPVPCVRVERLRGLIKPAPKRISTWVYRREWAEADGWEIERALYTILDEQIDEQREDFVEHGAVVGLAWHLGWTPDKDGVLTLGMAQVVPITWRAMLDCDALISLNFEIVRPAFAEPERWPAIRALVNHELCHLAISRRDDGTVIFAEDGRVAMRTRKHDLGEFVGIVARYGAWDQGLQAMTQAAARCPVASTQLPLVGYWPGEAAS